MLAALSKQAYRLSKKWLPKDQESAHRSHIHTEVMHIWLTEDMAKVSGDIGLDVGAGPLVNRPLFNTKHYIAVEPNARSAETGRNRFPDAEIHVCRIEDYEPEKPVDLAIACTVIGNKHFDPESVMPTIERVTRWLAPGGTFFFDVRPRVISYEPQVDEFVSGAFAKVDKRVYGRFDWTAPPFITARAGRILSKRAAWNVPPDPARRRLYYACFGKR